MRKGCKRVLACCFLFTHQLKCSVYTIYNNSITQMFFYSADLEVELQQANISEPWSV